jgi:tetratricopeptide (TPR) repeat protein
MTSKPSSQAPAIDAFLVALETRIQAAIASGVGTIHCRVMQARLLVLLEETTAAPDASGRRQRFAALAQAVGIGLMETELPDALPLNEDRGDKGGLPVRLYLRQRGQGSPYAVCNWRWQPAAAVADLFDSPVPIDSPEADAAAAPSHPPGALALVPQPSEEADETAEGLTNVDRFFDLHPRAGQAAGVGARAEDGTAHGPLDGADYGDDDAADREGLPPIHWGLPRWPWLEQRVAALPWRRLGGVAVSGLVLGSLAYGLSRPCVVGRCERRQVAADLSSDAIAQLNGNPSGAEVVAAHDQLLQAVQLLSAVPTWSPHYERVQGDLNRYRMQLVDVDWILQAQTQAVAAADKSQDPPHPIAHWVEVHLLWQRAIADLDRVPADSPVAELATTKRAAYAANYATIGDRIEAERAADNNLNLALQSAQIATIRIETAATRSAWEQAEQDWQTAVNALRRIPQGTLAHGEAEGLLAQYQVSLVETRTRVNREKAGDRAYQEATAAAQSAQQAEQQNQWTRAVGHWQQAVDQAQQVPPETSLHGEAQVLQNAYEGALQRARINLRQVVALQTLEEDLQAICPLGGDRCTYTTANRRVQITLQSPYDRAVSQSIAPPATTGTFTQPVTVVEATHELVQAIMQLGNRSQLPIELYDPQGGFIARYKPEYGGFMKH